MFAYRGYIGTVQHSETDGVLHGRLDGISDVITYEGATADALEVAFREAVDDYLALCAEQGKQPDVPTLGTDWARVDATTDQEIRAQIAADPDTAPELPPGFIARLREAEAAGERVSESAVDDSPTHTYVQQLARAYRFRDRYARLIPGRPFIPDESFNELHDFLLAAFQNCWHVKDWLRNDDTVAPEKMRAAVKDAESSRALMVAADMANGSKHLLLKSERVGAQESTVELFPELGGTVTVHHFLTLADGTRLRALQALDEALAAWAEILQRHNLEYFMEAPT